ncbi:PREDICTED: uncharacterized protein LOC104596583 [Nelumbo nucifera]|uniref:Uncharacterized protein LOC104596583 n=2 Tax=Nelumbo nucifera TaxID=4432 RepID=A0A1U8A4C1_NELNU|nr:PREDICTED: uncharacterized protein LOC104596583 [Nelumbo nucifera]DAD19602.1 TPA_asm: hypothetical protein HUJ06_021065 [Nelumbo nucifera]
MSVKRSRIARSSSQGEIGMFSHVRALESPSFLRDRQTTSPSTSAAARNSVKLSKPQVAAKPQRSRRQILTLASPVRETRTEGDDEVRSDRTVGGFLEECYSCKKKIGESDEVYMYSYLRAFCCPECRENHMALDCEVGNACESSGMYSIENQWNQRLKGQASTQMGTDTSSLMEFCGNSDT